ncbi:MAG: UDP-N-acetylmuramate:L-alanyl-gamma-D-glutamyl-meso-diaminopimelate ligase [Candidatus Hydrogenedentota bacterium]
MIPILSPGTRPKVHFSGIGGTGMVAGARLAVQAGWEVRGSDNPLYPPTSTMVAALGVPVAVTYAAENLSWDPDIVVLGNALSRGNPEVEAALDHGLHYVSLAEWMKDAVLRARRPVAICGTHGKTTTTALTAFVLDQCGLSPGYFIGGQPLDFEHSARIGSPGAPFVIEGDEYDTAFFDKRAKFFHYIPDIAVVTSIEFDHGDIYPNVEEIQTAFIRMLRQIRRGGHLVTCADNPRALSLREHAPCNVLTYGFAENSTVRWNGGGHEDSFQCMQVTYEGEPLGEFHVPLAGQHNAQNALAAIAVATLLGADPDAIRAAIRQFKGVKRRMEIFLEANDIVFVDDFAHHPTAIRETIKAAKSRWPDRRLWVLFEPRSNTTVTKAFQADLAESFEQADRVWLGPIYRADRIPESERLVKSEVVNALQEKGLQAGTSDRVEDIVAVLECDVLPGDVVLFLSNGAFGGIYDMVKGRFGARTTV